MEALLLIAIVLILLFGAAAFKHAFLAFLGIAAIGAGIAYGLHLTGADPLIVTVIVGLVALPFAIREQIRKR